MSPVTLIDAGTLDSFFYGMPRTPLPLPSFPLEARVAALRRVADWCDEGAPGGSPGALWSQDGSSGCAVGKALIELEFEPATRPHLGLSYAVLVLLGLQRGDESASEPVHRAMKFAINSFDAGRFDMAAMFLRRLADLLEFGFSEAEEPEAVERPAGVQMVWVGYPPSMHKVDWVSDEGVVTFALPVPELVPA